MFITFVAGRVGIISHYLCYGEINVCQSKAGRRLNVLYGDSQSDPQKIRGIQQDITGGTDHTSGECSLGQTIPI